MTKQERKKRTPRMTFDYFAHAVNSLDVCNLVTKVHEEVWSFRLDKKGRSNVFRIETRLGRTFWIKKPNEGESIHCSQTEDLKDITKSRFLLTNWRGAEAYRKGNRLYCGERIVTGVREWG